MRLLLVCLAAVVALAVAVVAGSGAAAQGGFAFGRFGGNIRPYTVTIAAGGADFVTGPVVTLKKRLKASQLAALRNLASAVHFTTLPSTNCAGTNPDVAATFIRVGARTVRVHGDCVARYNRLFLALSRAVGLPG
jgi:hypothetical protein